MNKQQVRDRILEIGVIPVVRANSAAEALLAAQASATAEFRSSKSQ